MPQAEIGCLYEWDGIKHLVDTLSLSYHALAPDYEHNPELLADMAAEYIKTKTGAGGHLLRQSRPFGSYRRT